jgi:histidinol-phosphate/aromatic aminotransferase/cobyric acid decarboxylase-like protein
LIKDLSGKKGLEGEYIRLAVRRPEENHCLTEALRALL